MEKTETGPPTSKGLKVAAFSCGVPPLGIPLEECNPTVATTVDCPLLAKGAILSDGRTRNALCAFDYCELRTGAHDLFRRRLANALSVNELQVEVHCIHQHDAPLCDVNAEMLTDLVPSPPLVGDPGFIASASEARCVCGATERGALKIAIRELLG